MWTFREALPIIAPYRMDDSSWTEGQAQCFHKTLYYMLLQVDARFEDDLSCVKCGRLSSEVIVQIWID